MPLITKSDKLKANEIGFTLIEIMVAVSIFVIVALVVTGTVITTSETNRKAQAIKVAIDNLSFALDSMSLKIRQGNTFRCLSSATDIVINASIDVPDSANNCDGDIGVAFLTPDDPPRKIIYLFDKSAANGKISYCNVVNGVSCNTNSVDITDNSLIDITNLRFYVLNAEASNTLPPQPVGKPRIAVALSGQTTDPKLGTGFYLQTTVSGK